MTSSDYIAIYGAALSTLLAIPTIVDFANTYFSSLRIICIDATQFELEKGKEEMQLIHFFDITIINRAKETKYFSHVSIELKEGKKIKLVSLDTFFVNTAYKNKLESGQSFKEVISYVDHFDFQKEQPEAYSHYRVKVEDSTGKLYKSKWYKSPIYYNPNTVKWKLKSKPITSNV